MLDDCMNCKNNGFTEKINLLIDKLEQKRKDIYPEGWTTDPFREVIDELREIIN